MAAIISLKTCSASTLPADIFAERKSNVLLHVVIHILFQNTPTMQEQSKLKLLYMHASMSMHVICIQKWYSDADDTLFYRKVWKSYYNLGQQMAISYILQV